MRAVETLCAAWLTAIFAGAMGAVLAIGAPASATTFLTVQSASGGGGEPVWGQSLTLNVGATLPDSSIPPTVLLDFVGFRIGDSGIGSPGRTTVYLHIYDSFGITAGGAVDGSAIGNLLAVSINTQDLETPVAPGTDVIWTFAQPALAKDVEYFYVLADDPFAATAGDFSNLVYSDLQVGDANPHGGGQAFHQTGDLGNGPASQDLFFRVQSTLPVPEPSTAVLSLFGLALLAGRGRRR
jgi:hypothetical protein